MRKKTIASHKAEVKVIILVRCTKRTDNGNFTFHCFCTLFISVLNDKLIKVMPENETKKKQQKTFGS